MMEATCRDVPPNNIWIRFYYNYLHMDIHVEQIPILRHLNTSTIKQSTLNVDILHRIFEHLITNNYSIVLECLP
jgi:hypothetical protein